MEKQQEVGRLEGHDEEAFNIITVEGNIAVSDHDSGPRLWNLETLKCTATLPAAGHLEEDNVLAASIAGNKVLIGCKDYGIKVWDIVAAGAPIALASLEGHTNHVLSITKSAGTALSGSGDETVRLWDLRTSSCVRTMVGHSGPVWSVDMDGHCRTAVSGSADGTVKLWDLGSGRCIKEYRGHSVYGPADVVMDESGSSFLSAGGHVYSVNAWVVGGTKARMTADFSASCPPGSHSRLFASRDLSRVAYCCISEGKLLELRYWK